MYVSQIKQDCLTVMSNDEVKTAPVVSSMVQEFMRLKQAHEYRRKANKKTGLLDMRKLSKYKHSENIFKSRQILDNAKSHSVYVMLDWSGSISQNLVSMVRQAVVLAKFCRKAKIPYKIFSFTDSYNRSSFFNEQSKYDVNVQNCRLVEYFSDDMGNEDFKIAIEAIYRIAFSICGQGYRDDLVDSHVTREFFGKYRLGGTPLNEALVAAKYIIEEHSKAKNVQVSNLIVLTDGEGSDVNFFNRDTTYPHQFEKTKTKLFVDPKNNKRYDIDEYTSYKRGYLQNYFIPYNKRQTSMMIDWIRSYGIRCTCLYITAYSASSAFKSFAEDYNGMAANSQSKIVKEAKDLASKNSNFGKVSGLYSFPNLNYYNDFYVVNPKIVFADTHQEVTEYDEDGNALKKDISNESTKKIAKMFADSMQQQTAMRALATMIVSNICENF